MGLVVQQDRVTKQAPVIFPFLVQKCYFRFIPHAVAWNQALIAAIFTWSPSHCEHPVNHRGQTMQAKLVRSMDPANSFEKRDSAGCIVSHSQEEETHKIKFPLPQSRKRIEHGSCIFRNTAILNSWLSARRLVHTPHTLMG
ncbi:unnamed protein product [Durusdinium trenchii]|uniref:Uncharacterized protein n=1 Tax=Durusdinium trenchii TaxID=1381693 RepID=A0ABP0MC95_9DINO